MNFGDSDGDSVYDNGFFEVDWQSLPLLRYWPLSNQTTAWAHWQVSFSIHPVPMKRLSLISSSNKFTSRGMERCRICLLKPPQLRESVGFSCAI